MRHADQALHVVQLAGNVEVGFPGGTPLLEDRRHRGDRAAGDVELAVVVLPAARAHVLPGVGGEAWVDALHQHRLVAFVEGQRRAGRRNVPRHREPRPIRLRLERARQAAASRHGACGSSERSLALLCETAVGIGDPCCDRAVLFAAAPTLSVAPPNTGDKARNSKALHHLTGVGAPRQFDLQHAHQRARARSGRDSLPCR